MRYRRVIKNNPRLAIYLFNGEMGVTGGDEYLSPCHPLAISCRNRFATRNTL